MALLTSFEPPRKPAAPEPGILDGLRSPAVLRIGTGLVLLLYYGIPAVMRGYPYVWSGAAWDWPDILKQAGLPAPGILAPIAAGLIAAVGSAWTLGFLTRLFAILFIPVSAGAILVAEKLDAKAHQPFCYLLLFTTITLVLFGSGNISVDQLFKLVERPKKKKKRGMFDDIR
ncbi:MAG: DoxX family protein [Verrucomicrobiaceae bacterium]|nr:DoxX family protein [Verrucomicrobiaceae bacterium]